MTDNEYREIYDKDPHKAQTELFYTYFNYVYAIVYNKLRSCARKEDIEECVEDVFTAVFISYDSSRNFNGDIKGFIAIVARRTAISMYRRLTRYNEIYTDDTETADIADPESITEKTERSILKEKLLSLIKSLGEPDSDIIIQKYYYNMKSAEIAEKHSITPSLVRMKCSRALKKLKKLLADEGYDLKEGNI